MTAEKWSLVRTLLDRALDDPTGRPRLLAELRLADPEVSETLERLLADLEEDGDEPDDRILGFRSVQVGSYTVVREIGRGGAGTVFLGTREEAGARLNAAIKILRRDFLRGTPRRAFQRELRALARLDHPNIARLLDWGEMGDGLFYLAIEYVDGPRITQFCAEQRMGIAGRLELFIQACEGVAHAHRNLLLHRDLKPSNILVSRDGRVKLVDFGVASELGSMPDNSLMTRAFTPAYASPEQFEGRDLTVASDIYSLGLVLYELLAGQLPYPRESAGKWIDDAPSLSARAILPEISGRELFGDLDSIVSKSVSKTAEMRYTSVEQLAADIQNFRSGRPVSARKASRFYVARRFLRRNRFQVGAAAAAAFALAVLAVVAMWQWRLASRNLAASQAEYEQLRSFARAVVANVDARTFGSPIEAQRRMAETVTQHLDRLSRIRAGDETLQLEIASAYLRLGSAQGHYMNPNSGDLEGAAASYRKAYEISRREWLRNGDRDSGLRLIEAAEELQGVIPDPAATEEFAKVGIAAGESLLKSNPGDADVMTELFYSVIKLSQRIRDTGRLDLALDSARRAIRLADQVSALRRIDLTALFLEQVSKLEYGRELHLAGRVDEALANQTESCGIARKVNKARDDIKSRRELSIALIGRADTMRTLHRYSEGLRDVSEALTDLTLLASEDPANDQAPADLSSAYLRKGDLLLGEGRIAEAVHNLEEAVSLRRQQYRKHPDNPVALRNYEVMLAHYATALLDNKGPGVALLESFDEVISLGRKVSSVMPSDVYAAAGVARAYAGKAEIALTRGDRQKGEQWLRESQSRWQDVIRRAPLDVDLNAAAGETRHRLAGLASGSENRRSEHFRPD